MKIRSIPFNVILPSQPAKPPSPMAKSINLLLADAGSVPYLPVDLTPLDREVLSSVLEGHSNKVIAQRLGVIEATAKVHLETLLRKINVTNRTQATIWALSNLESLPSGFA
jgi:DNA-binding NarL/FixJ family response regulator